MTGEGRAVRVGPLLSTPAQRITALTALIASAAALLFWLAVRHVPGSDVPVGPPWLVWVGAFALAEAVVVHVQVQREGHSFSLTDLVLVAGLFLLDPVHLVTAQLSGGALVLVVRRQSGFKLAFNLAQFALTSCLTVALFSVLARGSAWSDPSTWLAAAVAIAAATFVGGLCVFAVIRLSQDPIGIAELGHILRLSVPFAVGIAAIGMLAAYMALQNPAALILLALPSLLLIASYRAYMHARRQQEALQLLHETTSLLYNADDPMAALTDFLTGVRKGFRASLAELFLLGSDADEAATVSRSREGQRPVALMPLDESAAEMRLIQAALADDELTGPTGAAVGLRSSRYARQQGAEGTGVAVLRTEGRVHGLLVVGGRLGDVSKFSSAEVTLLGRVARDLATSLERGRLERDLRHVTELKEKLRHQAMHDALTGLPNRTLFLDRAEHAMHLAARTGSWPAVLYIDLDGFKPVNDAYGHEAGDVLLRQFAAGLRGCVRTADTAARLGGDEFAVLLHGPIDRAGVERVLGRIRAEMASPIDLGAGRVAVVGASIGVSMADVRSDVDTLVRNADTAMYTAKRRGGSSSVFFEESATPTR